MIHIYFYDTYGMKEIITLGNSHPKLYDESFGTYALEQLKRTNLKVIHTKEELDHYFENPERISIVWQMLAAGLLRNAFGRLLELYILLDRTLFLQEKGYQASLYEFFREDISPRNLGIVATK